MAGQEFDVEAIVREVHRRLQQLSDGGTANVDGGADTAKQASAKPAARQSAANAAELRLADRTITMGLVLGSWVASIPQVIAALMLLWRTAREDRTLQAELPGYTEFASETKYRLVPGIW